MLKWFFLLIRCQQECKTYHQISKLGEGGFGSVWKMRTPPKEPFFNTHKIVAMKRVVDPDAGSYAEVEMLKKLNHPNIVKYLTAYSNESNDLCIIMEYCEIGDLKDLIESRWPQIATEKNIIAIILNIAWWMYSYNLILTHRKIREHEIEEVMKSEGEHSNQAGSNNVESKEKTIIEENLLSESAS